jgi:hypothetical protein
MNASSRPYGATSWVRIGRPSSFADSGTLIRRLTADVQRPRERNKLPPASPPPDNPTTACTPANRFRSEPPNAATASCTTKPNAPDNAWPPSNAPRSAADLLRVLALELTCHPESTRPHAHSGDNLDADRQTVVVPPQRHVTAGCPLTSNRAVNGTSSRPPAHHATIRLQPVRGRIDSGSEPTQRGYCEPHDQTEPARQRLATLQRC